MQYIGIDMSKDSFHAAFDEQEVLIFENNSSGFKKFIKQLKDPKKIVIGVESTGAYHILFAQTLSTLGFEVRVINSLLTHRMIQSTIRKVKTDRTDALAIRRSLLTGAGYQFKDTVELLALKALVSEREALVRMRAQAKQRSEIHAIIKGATDLSITSSKAIIKALSKEITTLEEQMIQYNANTQALLRSIPGVGKVTAAALVAHIGDVARFSNPKKLVAYIGLDWRVHESGTSIKGKGYLTKRGNSYLRFTLFNAAFIARQYIPEFKTYFEKKLSEGKHYFSASCAIERKLVHLVYAVWTRGTPFENRLST